MTFKVDRGSLARHGGLLMRAAGDGPIGIGYPTISAMPRTLAIGFAGISSKLRDGR